MNSGMFFLLKLQIIDFCNCNYLFLFTCTYFLFVYAVSLPTPEPIYSPTYFPSPSLSPSSQLPFYNLSYTVTNPNSTYLFASFVYTHTVMHRHGHANSSQHHTLTYCLVHRSLQKLMTSKLLKCNIIISVNVDLSLIFPKCVSVSID